MWGRVEGVGEGRDLEVWILRPPYPFRVKECLGGVHSLRVRRSLGGRLYRLQVID